MIVILSKVKWRLIRGMVPLPIEPCPITHITLRCPYTGYFSICKSIITLLNIRNNLTLKKESKRKEESRKNKEEVMFRRE